MAAPFSNPVEKLCRAITAYLIGLGVGTVDDTFPMLWSASRSFPNTTVKQQSVFRPEPALTGNYRGNIAIVIKGLAVNDPGSANPGAARVAYVQRVERVLDALMQSDDNETLNATRVAINAAGRALAVDPTNGKDPVAAQTAANNADMVDFTLTEYYDGGIGMAESEEEGVDWVTVYLFDCCACSANVD